jgi:hypothetical protein
VTVEGNQELKEALRFPGWDEPTLGEKLATLEPGESTHHNGFEITRLGGLAESGKAPVSKSGESSSPGRGGSNPPPSSNG